MIRTGMAQTHLGIEYLRPSYRAAQNTLDLDPIITIILFENATRRERTNGLFAELFLDFFRSIGWDDNEDPGFSLIGTAGLPSSNRVDARQE